LRWTIKDLHAFGDQIVVRGEATGTPMRELFGAKPTAEASRRWRLASGTALEQISE
jgi:hypothetical protein